MVVSTRRPPLLVEHLEDRLNPSQTQVPQLVIIWPGTEFSPIGLLTGQSGRGGANETDIKTLASVADADVKAWNPKSQVIVVDWASLGDRQTPAVGLADYVTQILAKVPGPHDIIQIGFSVGAEPEVLAAKAMLSNPNVRRITNIYLDPTGNKLLNDPPLHPQENGPFGQEHNITYDDGPNTPYATWLAVNLYPLPGSDTQIPPLDNDPTKSHNDFPTWDVTSGQEQRDLDAIEQVTPSQASAAAKAAASAEAAAKNGVFAAFTTFSAPGHGENLLLPFLEAAVKHGATVLVDDAGHALAVATDKAGDLVVDSEIDATHAIESVVNSAGNVVSSTLHKFTHFGESILGDVGSWFGF